jgi:hypothetical protein
MHTDEFEGQVFICSEHVRTCRSQQNDWWILIILFYWRFPIMDYSYFSFCTQVPKNVRPLVGSLPPSFLLHFSVCCCHICFLSLSLSLSLFHSLSLSLSLSFTLSLSLSLFRSHISLSLLPFSRLVLFWRATPFLIFDCSGSLLSLLALLLMFVHQSIAQGIFSSFGGKNSGKSRKDGKRERERERERERGGEREPWWMA